MLGGKSWGNAGVYEELIGTAYFTVDPKAAANRNIPGIDKALGKSTPHLWCPFSVGLRCTEPGLLAVKAAKYPGQVLEWDRRKLMFTNHAEATKSIVRREYRKGFEPTRLG